MQDAKSNHPFIRCIQILTIFGGKELTGLYMQSSENNTPTSEMGYVISDHLGSAWALANENGDFIEQYAYDSWGRRMQPTDWTTPDTLRTEFKTDRGFTLHEHYDHMQIINMGARMYDPIMGQFISVDPLADKYPGWEPYVYCMNNPLIYVDPDGRDTVSTSITQTVNKYGVDIVTEQTTERSMSADGTVTTNCFTKKVQIESNADGESVILGATMDVETTILSGEGVTANTQKGVNLDLSNEKPALQNALVKVGMEREANGGESTITSDVNSYKQGLKDRAAQGARAVSAINQFMALGVGAPQFMKDVAGETERVMNYISNDTHNNIKKNALTESRVLRVKFY